VDTLTSADGTRIAFERLGHGPPLIVVGGALCDRARMRPVCAALGARVTAFNYDRRGRGDSGAGGGHDVEREIEDLAALVAEAGGSAAVYGHSSGAALALRAALAGLPFDRVVLHDAPFSPDGERERAAARAYHDELHTLVSAGRDGDAVALFMRLTGMPSDVVDAMRDEPWFAATAALGPSLLHDSAAMGNAERGAAVPADLIAAATVTFSTLVLVGDANPPLFLDAGRRLAEALPDARLQVLAGAGHAVDPVALVPPVTDFVTA
jgi:hypothetical protein